MRPILLLAVLVSSAALGQADGTIIRRRDLQGGSSTVVSSSIQATTTTAKTYYVDTAGSDSNNCTALTTPCLTITGAVAKVPKNIFNPSIISVGVGNFGAFSLSGFTVNPPLTSTANQLTIMGTLSTATLATGSATGTLSSFAATSGATFAVGTDGSQTWTVNDLRGKLIWLSGGTGGATTAIYPITSNTGTTVAFPALSTQTGGASTTYVILDWGTVINTTLPATGAVVTTVAPEAANGLRIYGNLAPSANGNAFNIVNMAFAIPAAVIVSVSATPKVQFTWSKFSDTGTVSFATVGVSVTDPASSVFFHGCYWNINANGIGVLSAGSALSLSRSYIEGGKDQVTAGGRATIANTYLRNSNGTSIASNPAALGGTIVVSSSRLDTGIVGIAGNSETSGVAARYILSSVDISTFSTAGIQLRMPATTASATTVSGTGNGIGSTVTFGASLQINSASTITGTTELVVDTTNTTLATMRAATPKALPTTASVYGTKVYE